MMVGVAVLMVVMMIQGISTRIFLRLFMGVRRSLVRKILFDIFLGFCCPGLWKVRILSILRVAQSFLARIQYSSSFIFLSPIPGSSHRYFRSPSEKKNPTLPCTVMTEAAPVNGISDNALATLSESSRACIERLRDHRLANE